jgi:hypothetical protein
MIGDHHGRDAGTATLLLTALDGILGTHTQWATCSPLRLGRVLPRMIPIRVTVRSYR